MPSTNFIDSVTPVSADWLNEIDAAIFDTLGGATTPTVVKTALSLQNVDNTSDVNKPVSTAQQTALNGKANTSHAHALSDLTQSGAANGQAPLWNGSAWVPGFNTGLAINIVTGTTQAATSNNLYVLTNVAATTVTLPASPSDGDTVGILVANALTTNSVDRNGKSINGLAENLTIDSAYAAFQLRYIDSTRMWRII